MRLCAYPEPFEPAISRYVPRVDYCTDSTWLYRRRREDDGGYVDAATRVTQSEDWEPAFAARSWGANIIRLTVDNGPQPGFGSPANWIAARVNMTLSAIPKSPFEPMAGAMRAMVGESSRTTTTSARPRPLSAHTAGRHS